MARRSHTIAALRPNRRVKKIWNECPNEQRVAAAAVATYEGSAYHRRSSSGQAVASRRYPAASKCDAKWNIQAATDALRQAIIAGLVSADWRSGFPRNVWYREESLVYEAFLHNEGSGAYHAFPLNKEEWPAGLIADGLQDR